MTRLLRTNVSQMDAPIDAVASFWNGLGAARGYVVGAIVTILGVLINVRALRQLENVRSAGQQTREQEAWDREREARLQEVRRETYAKALSACETRAFIKSHPQEERSNIRKEWRSVRGIVRLVTDDPALIEAADRMVSGAGTYSDDSEAFLSARTEFVRICRAELGRADINIKTVKRSPEDDMETEAEEYSQDSSSQDDR